MLRVTKLIPKFSKHCKYRTYKPLRIYNGIMDNMSENAVKSIVLAQMHMRYYKSVVVESEHLLLGIMSLSSSKVYNTDVDVPMYSNLPNFTIQNVQKGIEEVFGIRNNSDSEQNEDQFKFSEELRHILYLSERERDLRGVQFITPESMLLIMLSLENKCRAVDVLKQINVDISLLRDILFKELRSVLEINNNKSKKNNISSDILSICTNLCTLAEEGKIDPVFGREKEINQLIQVLSKRLKSNPIIVGEPGVGKTALAEGLAYKIVYTPNELPELLRNKKIIQLDIASLMAGTTERGELEQRLKNLIDYLKTNKNIILMIDEIHAIVGMTSSTKRSSTKSSNEITNILKPPLARGEFSCIGLTTYKEYSKYFQNDSAFSRRFQPIFVDEPSIPDTFSILKGLSNAYETYHNCIYEDSAIEAAISLSIRYIPDRKLPDKAIDLLDEAGSKMKLYKSETNTITDKEIKEIVTSWTGIPIIKDNNLDDIETILKDKIIGQDDVINSLLNILRRSQVDFRDPNRPIACLLFVGPTGVGKTELAKQLANTMYNNKLIRFDMSEYMEDFNISKLIGSPPGYVGYEEAGKLTEAVRRNPYSVVLFDEIEKANPSICNILLQILEDGKLTDSKGKKVSFKNTIIILTSNLGTKSVELNKAILEKQIMKEVTKFFKPELLNRFDEILMFNPLDEDVIKKIVNNSIEEFIYKLKNLGYTIEITRDTYDNIYKQCYNPERNARALRTVISELLEDKTADIILESQLNKIDLQTIRV